MLRTGWGAILALAALAAHAPAQAQTELGANVTGYGPAYFAANQPSSALDMVNLLPGFSLVEGNATVRGYSGAVGNVLIDGRPPASKQDTLSDILKRIPAGSVERIELLRPGAAGIDMQGYALLVNVVRKVSNALRIRLESEYVQHHHGNGAPKAAAEISLGSTYVLDLQGSANRDFAQQLGYGYKNRYRADGSPLLLNEYDHPKVQDTWVLQGTWRQPLLGGSLRLNALVNDIHAIGTIDERDYYPAVAHAMGGEREMTAANEFGLQYAHDLWAGADLEFIAIRRSSNFHQTQSFVSAVVANEAIKAAGTDETVGRTVGRQHFGNWNFEVGVEGALNGLNNHIAYRRNGALFSLPSANVKVSEVRAEGFFTGTWHVIPQLTLETGVRYEMSQLKQQGDTALTRRLSYLKPHILATWDVTGSDQIRIGYARQAGQLDFNNFVTSVNLSQALVSSGNPNLRPFTLWQSELAWEHRFKLGSVLLTARDQQIGDTNDRIMLTSIAGPLDALGNVGSGKRQELAVNFNFPLDWVHTWLSGVTVQGNLLKRTSSVIDPTTGERRMISNDARREGKITLTKDMPSIHMRWSASYSLRREQRTWRFNEFMTNPNPESIDAFIEYKPSPDWQIRLLGENLTNRPNNRVHDVYAGPRATSALSFTEPSSVNAGVRVGLNVQHTLGE